jgi:hypothetical protein
MTIHEPMTTATDYLLAGVAAWLSVLLFSSAQRSVKLWGLAFAALAMAALLGGTWHGFLKSDALWKATLLAAGGASFGMVAGSAVATLSGRARELLIGLASAKLLAYCLWMLRHDEFIYVVIDTGIALAVVMALHLWKWNGPLLAGVALSIVAALAQASGVALHEHFNHNDLYHVIQLAALVLLYRGAWCLTDSGALR